MLCHNDFYGPNLLVHDGRMSLIDWEYAAMGDYGCDFGNFVAQGSGYTVEEAIGAIPLYFGRMPTKDEEFHLLACTALVGWYWYVWALYKELKGMPRPANGCTCGTRRPRNSAPMRTACWAMMAGAKAGWQAPKAPRRSPATSSRS